MPLSSLAVQNAKPRENFYVLTDGNSLHLLVKPNGSRLWRFRYRFGGKPNMLGLGSFPEISLADARAKRDDARKLLANGIDPSRQKKLNKIAAATSANNTFGSIAEEHLKNQEESGTAASTMVKNRWYLQDLAAPLTNLPITEITPAEILGLLKKIETSGRRETARRVRGAIGSVFRLAITTLRATNDPTFPLRRALLKPNVQHRPAITDEAKLGALMVAIDEYDGWPTIRAALQLTALTMTRPGEVRYMRRAEILWPKATWRIPAERMKMRRPHDVPLSTQALAIIRDIWPLSEGHELVLPSIRSPRKALSENAMNSALRRIGYSKEEVCAHGFRSSASTILNERGFDQNVIETALAHQDEDAVRAVYNRAKYWPQRIKLLQDWADLLDEFRRLSAAKTAA
ncbi:MAG: integrase arm-type DNA-binding domain-containing protein [Xanthobacteraceae bacterium]